MDRIWLDWRDRVMVDDTLVEGVTMDEFLDRLCLDHGSSLTGRKKAFAWLTGRKRRVPVYVCDDIILVPAEKEYINWVTCPAQVSAQAGMDIRLFLRRLKR